MKTPGAEDHRADIRARPHAVSGRSSTARGRYEFACFFCTAEICRLSPPCTTRSTHPVCGADAGQKIWPDLRCESEARQGGEETGALRPQSKFLPACHGVHTGNAEEKLPGSTCFSRKAMANMMMDLLVHAPAARQRNFAGTSRHHVPAQAPPRRRRRLSSEFMSTHCRRSDFMQITRTGNFATHMSYMKTAKYPVSARCPLTNRI